MQDFHLLFIGRAYHLNEKITKYRPDTTPLCTFCSEETETYVHLFYKCKMVRPVWDKFQNFIVRNFDDGELFSLKNCLLSTFDNAVVSLMSIVLKRRVFLDRINAFPFKYTTVIKDIKRVKRCHYLKVKNFKNQLKYFHQFWSILASDSLFDEELIVDGVSDF